MKCFKASCIKLKRCKEYNFGLPCPHENMHTALHIFHTSNLFPTYCNPGHLWLDSTYLKKKEELQQEYKFSSKMCNWILMKSLLTQTYSPPMWIVTIILFRNCQHKTTSRVNILPWKCKITMHLLFYFLL